MAKTSPCLCFMDPKKNPFSVCGTPCPVHYKAWEKAKLAAAARRKYNKLRKEAGRHPKPTARKCIAEIWHGPGHQSRAVCEQSGPHKQHAVPSRGFYWSKRKAYSDYFNRSPEDER
jgi:hypothetical protein